MACLHDCDGWKKCFHLTCEDDGFFIECAKGMEVRLDGENGVTWEDSDTVDCPHYDPESLLTSCSFWDSAIHSIYSKRCGACDSCEGEGDQKYHARVEEGR